MYLCFTYKILKIGILSEGRKRVEPFLGQALFGSLGIDIDPTMNEFLCPLRNVSECALATSNDNIILLVYNPLARPIAKYIKFPVAKDAVAVKIYNDEGEEVNVDLLEIHSTVKNIPGRNDEANTEAIFYASDIPALGYRSFYVHQLKNYNYDGPSKVSKIQYVDMENPDENMMHLHDDLVINMEYYISSEEYDQPSGAYVFRPHGENDDKIQFTIANVSIYQLFFIL